MTSTPRKIAVMASSRATYGYKRRVIGLIEASPLLELQLIVTGMHLLPEYGYSVTEIEADGYPIAARVHGVVGGNEPAAWSKTIGASIMGFAQAFDMLKPDLVLVTGDRGEMFAAAVCAAYMNLPIAHIQAGDVSGHIDGSARHAITKFAHVHLASCEDSAERVRRLGEEPWRVHDVGAPQLDDIVRGDPVPVSDLQERFGVDFSAPTLLVIQHPVLKDVAEAKRHVVETLEAVKMLGMQTIIVFPNVDSGNADIVEVITSYEELPFVGVHRNIERAVFLGLLRHASVLIGNSSCALLEAPSFKLPAVNIGDRQRGRMRASNVVDAAYDRHDIVAKVDHVLHDEAFTRELAACTNPYGDGHSSERIVTILEEVELGPALLEKQITY